jgi:hypothetical protein
MGKSECEWEWENLIQPSFIHPTEAAQKIKGRKKKPPGEDKRTEKIRSRSV